MDGRAMVCIMRRRDFIAGMGITAALSFAELARAQTTPSKRIALISPSRSVDELHTQTYFRALLDELSRRGFVEGKNLIVDRYSGLGNIGSYADLVRAVVATNQDAVFTNGFPMVSLLKASTATIPIVATIDDPVAEELASSLARPGTNLTGVTVDAGLELYGKRLALLVEARPNASVIGYLSSSHNWTRPAGAAVREAAQQAKTLTH
jgi:putative tryptophan/tyrosine transport system substrate-binding protein